MDCLKVKEVNKYYGTRLQMFVANKCQNVHFVELYDVAWIA